MSNRLAAETSPYLRVMQSLEKVAATPGRSVECCATDLQSALGTTCL